MSYEIGNYLSRRGEGYEPQANTNEPCARCNSRCWLRSYEGVSCGACGWHPGDPSEVYKDRRRRRPSDRYDIDKAIDRDLVVMRRALDNEQWQQRESGYAREVAAEAVVSADAAAQEALEVRRSGTVLGRVPASDVARMPGSLQWVWLLSDPPRTRFPNLKVNTWAEV